MTESLGTASSIPREGQTPLRGSARGGEAVPSDWRYWFARAHIAWARRRAPWLLKEWLR